MRHMALRIVPFLMLCYFLHSLTGSTSGSRLADSATYPWTLHGWIRNSE
jgi:hypothetical protein